MRKIIIILMTLLVALSILILPACAAAFTDVAANHWAFNEISLLTEKGIVSGMGDGTFAPDTFVTREQFIKLLVLSCGIDVFGLEYFEDNSTRNPQICYFSDVSGKFIWSESMSDYIKTWSWSAPYVYTAVMNGIVKYSDYTPTYVPGEYAESGSGEDRFLFYPEQPLTRDETARYISRALSLVDGERLKFADSDKIAHKDDVSRAVQAGLLKGFEDNTFRPDNNTTRAEMAVIMMRIIQYTKDYPFQKKSFSKILSNTNQLIIEANGKVSVKGVEIEPCLVPKSTWDSLIDNSEYTLNNVKYRVATIDGFKGLIPLDSEGNSFYIDVKLFDQENYVFIANVSYGPIIYTNTKQMHEYTLSDDFSYFSEDNEAGQQWFKYYDKNTFVETYGNLEEYNLFVVLQIVDDKVLFAYDIG